MLLASPYQGYLTPLCIGDTSSVSELEDKSLPLIYKNTSITCGKVTLCVWPIIMPTSTESFLLILGLQWQLL